MITLPWDLKNGTIAVFTANWAYKNPGPGVRSVMLKGHSGPVRSIVFTRDSKKLVSAGDDGTVRIWTFLDSEFVRTGR